MDHGAEVVRFYEDLSEEAGRLDQRAGLLERLRTQDIIGRDLSMRSSAKLAIADVGGGPGVYAQWLARLGHHVALIDPVKRHVEQAARLDAGAGSIQSRLGDARSLDLESGSVDVVLLLGPLYHLLAEDERLSALAEAFRVLRPGGVLFATAISRFASLHDGLAQGFLFEPEFADIVATDVVKGTHTNPKRRPGWFTSAYFHRPDELVSEVLLAGFDDVSVFGLEGPAGWLPDLDERLASDTDRATILRLLAGVECEPSLLGSSAHLLARALRPEESRASGSDGGRGAAGIVRTREAPEFQANLRRIASEDQELLDRLAT